MSSTAANTCVTNVTNCNTAKDCDYCPFDYVMQSSSSTTSRSVTCTACNADSNCQRCLQSNTATCTSCNGGTYLNSQSVCASCSDGCSRCISTSLCFVCSSGYVAKQVAKLTTSTSTVSAVSSSPVSCEPCTSPCSTCSGDPTNCLTCVSGYTFKGTKCVSNFNYQLSVVLGVTTSVFNEKYLDFVSDVASSLSTTIDKISILSLRYGSVAVVLQASTTNTPNSQAAINQQNALTNAANSGSLGGMTVTSSSVTTNGGSNSSGSDDDDSGLSRTTIIILAVCIPCGVLRKDVLM